MVATFQYGSQNIQDMKISANKS